MLKPKIDKIVPRTCQKQPSNRHHNLHRFWNQLGSILGGIWEPSWSQVGTKSLQKSIPQIIQKSIIKPTSPTTKIAKNIKKHYVLQWFLLLRPCHVEAKNQWKLYQELFQTTSQINTLTCIDLGTNLAPFWKGLGGQVAAKLAQNRSKSRFKKWSTKWSPLGRP